MAFFVLVTAFFGLLHFFVAIRIKQRFRLHGLLGLAEKLQVSKNDEWGDRQIIAAYQINLPIEVAGGQCKANITYGIGGGQQYLIPKTCLSGPVGYFVYENGTLVCVYKKPNITIPNVGPGGTIPFITNQL